MGKKMGINSKAVEARERKEAQKKAKQDEIERHKEAELWRDDDKHANRKIDRQREKELKAQQERDRKAALKVAYEQEMELAEKSAKSKSKQQALETVPKVSRHDIRKNLEEEQAQLSKQMKKVNLAPVPLVPNLNRLEEGESATTIDQALDILKSSSSTPANAVSSSSPSISTSKKRN